MNGVEKRREDEFQAEAAAGIKTPKQGDDEDNKVPWDSTSIQGFGLNSGKPIRKMDGPDQVRRTARVTLSREKLSHRCVCLEDAASVAPKAKVRYGWGQR